MTSHISRRVFLKGAAATALVGTPYVTRGAELIPLRTATLAGGWTNLTNSLLLEKGFDRQNGLKFSVFNTYTSVRQYYADFVQGNIQVGVGTWDFFAKVYMKGVPIRLVGVISTGSLAGFFAGPDGPNSLDELKGRTLAAMQASGTYQMTKTWVKEFANIAFEKDVNVQNVPNPPATIALVAGKRADAALTWEHSLSTGLHKIKGSKVFLNVNTFYRKHTGRDMPYFCIAIRSDAIKVSPPGTVAKVAQTYAAQMNWIHANEEEFAQRARTIKLDPAILRTALGSGRMRFKMRSMAEAKHREDVMFAANILTKAGTFPKKLDEGFFAA